MGTVTSFEVGGYLPTSLLDWDGRVAAAVFTRGCNLRCPFCHNPELVLGRSESLDPEEILGDLRRRRDFLDGVAVSGGEPCLQSGLASFLRRVVDLGLGVKLDTNGTLPQVLEPLLEEGLVDQVALDVKAPWGLYDRLSGVEGAAEKVKASLALLHRSGVDYELRTTWVPALLSEADLLELRDQMEGEPRWVVQAFRPGRCLDPALDETAPASLDRMVVLLPGVTLRG